MGLANYKGDLDMCCRCSACKFIPLQMVKGSAHSYVCPSIARYNFHAYSGGGRIDICKAVLRTELKYADKLLDVVYNCQVCGACDTSCKYAMDMEVLEPIQELRIECVEKGYTLPSLDKAILGLREQDTLVGGAKAKRGEWAKDLDVKNYTEQPVSVIYHAGCRTCFDPELWKIARTTINLLKEAGIDVGTGGKKELCCGGRAYQMGYKEDFINQAQRNMELFQNSGAEILVTGCADCYHAFKVLYDKFGFKDKLEILHTTEYLDRLMKEGKLKPIKPVKAIVTYHDPCHVGRQGEPYIHWEGKRLPGYRFVFDPPKVYRRGTYGIYRPPREILKSIPGLRLVEMDRIKEYAWCCGAGGGVSESNPEFATWTAKERLAEAESTGAEALVTACPGCESLFKETLKANGNSFQIYDIVELLEKSI
jgi:Fe-S oxidoreductase